MQQARGIVLLALISLMFVVSVQTNGTAAKAKLEVSIIESIENTLDNNCFRCGIFLDLEKAFDTDSP